MIQDQLKKLIYTANHRGMKETDVLLGKFASARLVHMESQDQHLFSRFLEELDADILAWCLGSSLPPTSYQALITEILAFRNQQR